METPLDQNFQGIGKLLASLGLDLYRHPDRGLLRVAGGKPTHVATAHELAPLLIDHVRISVTKHGKFYSEKPGDAILKNMLMSRSFLSNFPKVEEVVSTPVALPDHSASRPGYNQGGVLYLGPALSAASGMDTIDTFLDIMDFRENADRTNSVAAALTVLFRRHFPGAKPLVLVMSTKSHGGKGTIIEFVRGETAKAQIEYQDKDWPMQVHLYEQLRQRPDLGVIDLDNIRTDSSGRAKVIRSAFFESFVTNSEIILGSVRSGREPIRTFNRFVVLTNTNEGCLSIDLLNRSLPIHLNPVGDLEERLAKAKARLGGGVKDEWLPANRKQLTSELWGMIDRWVEAGRPADQNVSHPMSLWAQTIGGILMVNGFKDFLANYSATRATADPIREALGILAFHAGKEAMRAGKLAEIAVAQGLGKTLMPGVDPALTAAAERQMGVVLSPYVGEVFTARTAIEQIAYRLKKESKRWDRGNPHYRYTFEEIGRKPVTGDALSGPVLEDQEETK